MQIRRPIKCSTNRIIDMNMASDKERTVKEMVAISNFMAVYKNARPCIYVGGATNANRPILNRPIRSGEITLNGE